MHIQWGWIKQRPHFLALELATKFKVSIFTLSSFKSKPTENLCENNNIDFHTLKKFPFSKNKFINKINKIFIQIQIKKIMKMCDTIWVTHPLLYYYIKDSIPKNFKVFYDCMDDALEFSDVKNNTTFLRHIQDQEKSLLDRVDCVFFSSKVLSEVVKKRYMNRTLNYRVINNALEPSSLIKCSVPKLITEKVLDNKKNFILGYFGTLSEWFDFELINELLNENSDLCIMLLGPNDCIIPNHPRVIHLGSVEHKFLYSITQLFDALIMPFKINDLIKSVDPVKLYEYIAFERPVIACRYEETEKFLPHIHLYSNLNELQKIIIKIKLNKNEELNDKKDFINSNSWQKRADEISEILLDENKLQE